MDEILCWVKQHTYGCRGFKISTGCVEISNLKRLVVSWEIPQIYIVNFKVKFNWYEPLIQYTSTCPQATTSNSERILKYAPLVHMNGGFGSTTTAGTKLGRPVPK